MSQPVRTRRIGARVGQATADAGTSAVVSSAAAAVSAAIAVGGAAAPVAAAAPAAAVSRARGAAASTAVAAPAAAVARARGAAASAAAVAPATATAAAARARGAATAPAAARATATAIAATPAAATAAARAIAPAVAAAAAAPAAGATAAPAAAATRGAPSAAAAAAAGRGSAIAAAAGSAAAPPATITAARATAAAAARSTVSAAIARASGGAGAGVSGRPHDGPATQKHFEDALMEKVLKRLEDHEKKVAKERDQHIDQRLESYHAAANSFSEAHQLVDILDVDPSRSEGDKVVIVFNSIQLDEMKTMVQSLRTHQRHQELLEQGVREMRAQLSELQRLQARVVILERKVEEQDGQHSEHRSPQRSRRRNESDSTSEPAPKRARAKPGRPDAKIQDAFLELLRAGFGIDSNEGWPHHPTVSRDSPDWPRHTPIASAAVAAAEEGELVGDPMDRLDWMEGRLDDRQFKAILSKHTRTIMEKADEFDLPDEEDVRTHKYIYAACHRSLEWLKRTCRQKREVGAAAMKEKKDAKDQTDRRTKRRKARRKSRHQVARGGSDRISGAMADMVVLPCIEADESGMEEGLDDVCDDDLGLDDIAPGKRTKTLRPIIPEWWSKENKDLQHKLARRAPASNIKCRVLEATHLTSHQEPVPAEVPRIAVSSTFAERYPHLVLDVKENSPPFKPERGAVAESAESWGSPIADLVLLEEASSGTGGGGEAELGGEGAGVDGDEDEVGDEDEDEDDGMDMS